MLRVGQEGRIDGLMGDKYDPFMTKAPSLKALLVCASPVNSIKKIQTMAMRDGYQIVAVDGGYDTVARTGLRPVLSIGDFDSTEYDEEEIRYNSENVVELLIEKDKTDFEEALEEVIYRGFDTLAIFGILGGKRIDFELNNLLVLSKYASVDRKMDVYSDDGSQVMSLLCKGMEFHIDDVKNIDMSKPLSIIPVVDSTLSIKGMEYDYEGMVESTSSHSMSNRARPGGVIRIKSGIAYVGYSIKD